MSSLAHPHDDNLAHLVMDIPEKIYRYFHYIIQWRILAGLLLAGWLFAACSGSTPATLSPTAPASTPSHAASVTLPPQATKTPEPLGSPQNPLVIGWVRDAEKQDGSTANAGVAEQVAAKTGYTIQSAVSPSYTDLLDAFRLGEVHIAFLPPITYLLAQDEQIASVALLTNHFGVYHFGSQFLANADSQFTSYFDPAKNKSTADAAHALVQFAGKRPCLVDATSTSGYLLPMGILAAESIKTLPAVITQDPTSVVRALYAKGICDFGATFAISGDARTAESLQPDLADAVTKIPVIWQTDAVIPNMNLSFTARMTVAMRTRLRDGFLSLVQDQPGRELLSKAAGYEIADMKAVGEDEYAPLKGYLEALGVDLRALVGK
ncbi:MAG: PhnD/SsuA/transferrin family substrate-binding protein [Anaerolineaceae bacterium]|nr:PhnD/SsuA/transferrin family substrate-binding protein [Anaerolineaceae bacterium]